MKMRRFLYLRGIGKCNDKLNERRISERGFFFGKGAGLLVLVAVDEVVIEDILLGAVEYIADDT